MKNKKSTKVLATLFLMSVSTSFLAFPQTFNTIATTKSTQIITKLSQDVVLTEKQKTTIKFKMDSLAVNIQKNGEATATSNNLTLRKGIRKIFNEVQDSILTPDQLKILKEKQEQRKKVLVEQFKTM